MDCIFLKKQQLADFTLLKDYCFFHSKSHSDIFSRNFSFLKENIKTNTQEDIITVNLTHQYTFDHRSKNFFFSEIEHFRCFFNNKKLIEKNTYSFKDSDDYKNSILAFDASMYTNIPDKIYDGFTYLTIAMDDCIAQYKMSFSQLRSLRDENTFLDQVHADCRTYNLDMQLNNHKGLNHKVKI